MVQLTDKITTPEGRFSYLTVFEARAVSSDQPDKKKFGVTLIFDKVTQQAELAQIQELYNLHVADLTAKGKIPTPHIYQADPFIDCDAFPKWTMLDDYAEVYQGKLLLRLGATEQYPPKVLAINEAGTYDVINVQHNRIKSGDYGRAVIGAFSFTTQKNNGVSFGLEMIVKDKDGDALGASSISVDDAAAKLGITVGDATGAALPNAPVAPVVPTAPAAPAAPVVPPPVTPPVTPTAEAKGLTYESLIEAGWNDDQMRTSGYIV